MGTHSKQAARRKVGRPGDGEDVRGAMVAAALRQLEATDTPERVTVATIIDEAGCTPPSLYHYWPKRQMLLQEASQRGWAQFRGNQASAVAEHHDPVERLRFRGQAYLDFALAKPALFRVLFLEPSAAGPDHHRDHDPDHDPDKGPDKGPDHDPDKGPDHDPDHDPDKGPAQSGKALDDLVTDVAEAMASGQLRPADPLTIAIALWSAIHGVAALWTVTPTLPTDLAHAVGDLAQNALLAGLSA